MGIAKASIAFFFFSFLVVSILSSLEKRIASYDFDLVSLQKKKRT